MFTHASSLQTLGPQLRSCLFVYLLQWGVARHVDCGKSKTSLGGLLWRQPSKQRLSNYSKALMAERAVDTTFEESLLEVTRPSLLFQSPLKWKWKQSRQVGKRVWPIALHDTNFLNWSNLQKGLESLSARPSLWKHPESTMSPTDPATANTKTVTGTCH